MNNFFNDFNLSLVVTGIDRLGTLTINEPTHAHKVTDIYQDYYKFEYLETISNVHQEVNLVVVLNGVPGIAFIHWSLAGRCYRFVSHICCTHTMASG